MLKIQEVVAAVESGKSKVVTGLVQEALTEGAPPIDILNAMIDAMGRVGERFQKSEIYVPDMLVAARTMKIGVETLKPLLGNTGVPKVGKVVIGTVAGDLHDIGKNLVAMMIESAGFEVIDLGVDVSTEKFLEAVENDAEVNIVALSSLLATTMASMEATVEALNASTVRSRFKIMVGGAPITQEFADKIGADAYTDDAASAAQKAKALVR